MANYKNTLNMPSTTFEMKANLNTREPKMQEFWLKNDIYQKVLAKNKNHKCWVLHDGPPYANGDIHVGHALNKIIKDIMVRYHLMKGDYSPYIPGWDTHGLPIEHALLKKNPEQSHLDVIEQRKNCHEFALKNVKNQLVQFQRLGLITDFKDIYLTLNPEFEIDQLNLFLKMVEQKLVFTDYKPVYWSWSSHTALAEAEIEYADMVSDSIYVGFKVSEGISPIQKDDILVIWTTTPWTIPSNLAIAVNPAFTYVRVKYHRQVYVVAQTLLKSFATKLGWDKTYEVLNQIKGKKLDGIKYLHPLTNEINPIIMADYVSDEDGTGLVHNAPGFGLDDYYACKANGIGVYCPIDDYGKFTDQCKIKSLVGVFYEKANPMILDLLKQSQALLHSSQITHSAAIDWRTKKPIIYRATKQWFINIKPIHDKLLDALKNVNFPNESNRIQLTNMISNRQEWCISRQRIWGVPIPIIYDAQNSPILDPDLIAHIIEVLKEKGIDSWFSEPASTFLTKNYPLDRTYRKEQDIMDVWFDSGSSYNVLKHHHLSVPCDLYFEGSDQYRGWFNSSLICSVIQHNTAPYKNLISHGFTLDELGRKMSKSLGNVVDPLDMCNTYGADILRLWAASVSYGEDVRISKNIIDQIAEIYRRIRNTLFKFILGNLNDFSLNKHRKFTYSEADYYILHQLKNNLKIIMDAYEHNDFALIIKTINLHAIELSGWYFDLIKDCLYCDAKNDLKRYAIQNVLYYILMTYLSVLAPIIPHTCEECYQTINFINKKESIFLTNLVTNLQEIKLPEINEQYWKMFFNIKNAVYLKLEELRKAQKINKNNQAKVVIKLNNENFEFKPDILKQYLNVAIVEIKNDAKIGDNKIEVISVENANLVRCERCWNYFSAKDIDEDHLCPRCHKLLYK